MTTPAAPRLAGLSLARSTLDRAAERRSQTLVDELLAEATTRVLEIADGRAPVTAAPALLLRPPQEDDPGRLGVFLGQDCDGTAYVAVLTEAGSDEAAVRWAGLREVGVQLDARDAGLMTEALALLNWHATHTRCPRCGQPTRVVQAGWVRRCEADGSEHYPRTDPAVIMTVVDADDRLLLGRQVSWPQGRYSTLAGFVEPGESLEAAVRREVLEEVGVAIGQVTYLGSQPWPFPASVMVGFTASATSTDIHVDGVEIEQARWFSRAQLRVEVTAGRVLSPNRLSIARHLIEHWYGEPLGDEGTWR